MKIGLDITHVAARGGIGTYAREVTNALLKLDMEDNFTLFCRVSPKDIFKSFREMPFASQPNMRLRRFPFPGRWLQSLWNDFNMLPIETFCRGADIFHGMANFLPAAGKTKLVLTLHDRGITFEDSYDFTWIGKNEGGLGEEIQRWFLREKRWCLNSLKRADGIILGSEFLKRSIVAKFPGLGPKIRVIPFGISDVFRRPLIERHIKMALTENGIDGEFILFVGNLGGRKNVKRLLEAFSILKNRGYRGGLALCGLSLQMKDIRTIISDMKLENDVIYAGWVGDKEKLAALYKGASLFVYPSLEDSFGFPVLEAMAAGAPVVASNVTAIPEVSGGAAYPVDPFNVEEMAHAMEKVLGDSELASELKRKGLEWSRQFTWERTAKETLKFYHEIAG